MELRNLLFTGMDIPNEAQKLLGTAVVTEGMTIEELSAYEMGVKNTLNAVRAMIESDEHIVFHLTDHPVIEEFDLYEMIEVIEEHEGK